MTGLLLSDDLIFTSRITATARDQGLTVVVRKSAADLATAARSCWPRPTGVILDLANPGLDVAKLLGELRECCPRVPYVVGYGPHVDAEGLRAARQAGCDLVMPRSQFVERLEAKLSEWVRGRRPEPPPATRVQEDGDADGDGDVMRD